VGVNLNLCLNLVREGLEEIYCVHLKICITRLPAFYPLFWVESDFNGVRVPKAVLLESRRRGRLEAFAPSPLCLEYQTYGQKSRGKYIISQNSAVALRCQQKSSRVRSISYTLRLYKTLQKGTNGVVPPVWDNLKMSPICPLSLLTLTR